MGVRVPPSTDIPDDPYTQYRKAVSTLDRIIMTVQWSLSARDRLRMGPLSLVERLPEFYQ